MPACCAQAEPHHPPSTESHTSPGHRTRRRKGGDFHAHFDSANPESAGDCSAQGRPSSPRSRWWASRWHRPQPRAADPRSRPPAGSTRTSRGSAAIRCRSRAGSPAGSGSDPTRGEGAAADHGEPCDHETWTNAVGASFTRSGKRFRRSGRSRRSAALSTRSLRRPGQPQVITADGTVLARDRGNVRFTLRFDLATGAVDFVDGHISGPHPGFDTDMCKIVAPVVGNTSAEPRGPGHSARPPQPWATTSTCRRRTETLAPAAPCSL